MSPSWEVSRESRRCSRDNFPDSYITEYVLIYDDKNVQDTERGRLEGGAWECLYIRRDTPRSINSLSAGHGDSQ
jgi:hypothetical protein